MKVSKRAQSVPPSATIAVTSRAKEMAAEGIDVVSFAAGEPDFDTPNFIKTAAIEAINAGKTGYTAANGILKLRNAIAEKLASDNELDYTPDQIIVNIGAKHSVYTALQAVIDPGDDVLLPAPYWVTYPEAVKLAGGKVKVIHTEKENSYKLTPELLESSITDRTALLILNSPNNPGGFSYTPQEFADLAEVLEDTDVMVLSDEIYEKLVYGGTKFVSFAAVSDDAYERTLTINGFSKAFAMTGWRLGYTAGPLSAIRAMGRLQSHMTSNAVTFVQEAALAALADKTGTVESMRVEFEKRGNYMAKRLNELPGIQCHQPTGAFYCFPDVSSLYGRTMGQAPVKDSMSFAQVLLEQANVAVVPGEPFGCPDNVRLSFACSTEQIEKGLDRIEKWLSS
ncbi:Aspartate aminotransferase [Anaerohalosphaera lusitana]|uniref:Aminotransferase n=1 Tax=Anaerohalosphaera lusitana TaxID=1936003 RepID=A0A1U9NMI2_9BACT|nr:pyridoxal phosphate-dependent aminotransferase [Anaerohalosphaera lusitana]AQT69007.1 Aspartate aminotransferase [Anaerohalosphaera lusitana]